VKNSHGVIYLEAINSAEQCFRAADFPLFHHTMARDLRFSLVLFLALLSGSAVASPTTPVVFWSKQSGLFGSNEERHIISDVDTESGMVDWVKSNTESSPLELLIAFKFPSDAVTSGLRDHSNVRLHIENAKSSVVLPFIPSTDALLATDAVVAGDRYTVSSWEDVLSFTSSHPNVMSNKVCDILVVDLPNAVEFDEQFVKLQSSLAELNVAYALPVHHQIAVTPQYRSNSIIASRRLDTTSVSPTKYVYMTPDLLAGILTGILLVMIALIGLSCLNSIQTPSQFSDKVTPLCAFNVLLFVVLSHNFYLCVFAFFYSPRHLQENINLDALMPSVHQTSDDLFSSQKGIVFASTICS
jgi:hypothetical protein